MKKLISTNFYLLVFVRKKTFPRDKQMNVLNRHFSIENIICSCRRIKIFASIMIFSIFYSFMKEVPSIQEPVYRFSLQINNWFLNYSDPCLERANKKIAFSLIIFFFCCSKYIFAWEKILFWKNQGLAESKIVFSMEEN